MQQPHCLHFTSVILVHIIILICEPRSLYRVNTVNRPGNVRRQQLTRAIKFLFGCKEKSLRREDVV